MIIEREQIPKYASSSWGTTYHEIAVADLLELLKGKVLYLYDGEYDHFVYLDEKTLKRGDTDA